MERFKGLVQQKIVEVQTAKAALVTVTGNARASSAEQVKQAKASVGSIRSKQAQKRASSAQEKAIASLAQRRMSRAVLLRRRSSAASEDPPVANPMVQPPAPLQNEGGGAGGEPVEAAAEAAQ